MVPRAIWGQVRMGTAPRGAAASHRSRCWQLVRSSELSFQSHAWLQVSNGTAAVVAGWAWVSVGEGRGPRGRKETCLSRTVPPIPAVPVPWDSVGHGVRLPVPWPCSQGASQLWHLQNTYKISLFLFFYKLSGFFPSTNL